MADVGMEDKGRWDLPATGTFSTLIGWWVVGAYS